MRVSAAVFVALGLATLPAVAQRAEPDIAYGTDSLQRLDLTVPAGRGFATVLFIHGGSLATGDKRDEDYGKVCAPFAAAGVACASMNYRLFATAAWPAAAEDVAAALGWLRQHIAARGGDPSRIFLLGHSSGARLAVLVGTDPVYLKRVGLLPGDLRGVIGMGSIMWDLELENAIAKVGRARVDSFFAKDPDSARYGGLDRYIDSWPMHHVSAGLPPMLLLIAEEEQEHPPVLATNKKFVEQATIAGDHAAYVVLAGRSHYSAIRKLHETNDPVFGIILEFVKHPPPAAR